MSVDPKRVLLVDDVVEIRYLLRMLLANVRFCHVVGEAENGEEAIELAGRVQPHVIILDVQMPLLDGLAALPALAAAAPGAKVIVYSSAGAELERDALARGAFRYVRKGKDPTLVVDAVREAVFALDAER